MLFQLLFKQTGYRQYPINGYGIYCKVEIVPGKNVL